MLELTSQLHNCFLCLRRATLLNRNSCDPVHDVTQNAEICKRFTTLASRYLNLVSDGVAPEITLSHCQNSSSTDKYLCDDCVPVAESFCQMYHAWLCLRLEMNRCLDKIGQLIVPLKEADKESQPRQFSNDQNQVQMRSTRETEDKLNFKGSFLKQLEKSTRKSYPHLKLRKENWTPTTSTSRPAAATDIINEQSVTEALNDFKLEVDNEPHQDDRGGFINENDEVDDGPLKLENNNYCPTSCPTTAINQVFNVQSVSEAPNDFKLEVDDESYLNDTNDHTDFPNEELDGEPLMLENDATTIQNDGSVPDEDPLADTETTVDKYAVLLEEPSQQYICSECPRQFSTQKSLTQHITVVHMAARSLPCVVCAKQFGTSSLLDRHVRTHTKEKPEHCNVCHREFRTREELVKHKRVVHLGQSLPRHKCRFCPKQYTSKYHCQVHENKYHENELSSRNLIPWKIKQPTAKSYKCKLCQIVLSSKSGLNHHLQLHSEEQPFKCNICGKGFRRKDYLQGHMFTHTGEGPLKCSTCPKTFLKRLDLTRHIRYWHTNEKPFKCSACARQFARKWDCVRHCRQIHSLKIC